MQYLKYRPNNNSFIYHGESNDVQLSQVVWHITGACKLNCKYCFGPPKEQSFCMTRVDDVLNMFKYLNVQKIDISGGEPLLHKGFPEICKSLCDLGINITVTTSGLGTKNNIDWLLNSVDFFQRIIFSLDSINKESHNLVRGHAKAFDSVMNLINEVKSKGGKLRINTVVTKLLNNDEEIRCFSKFINKLNPTEWCVIEPKRGGNNNDFFISDYIVNSDDFEKIADRIKSEYKKVIFRKSSDYARYYILQPNCLFQINSETGEPSFSLDFKSENIEMIESKIRENDIVLPMDQE